MELVAIRNLFGAHARALSISSTKSATGHLLGAAGALEAIFSILALQQGAIPPTLNLHESDVGTDLDLTPLETRPRKIRYVLSNSFGFGGTNAALIFGPAP